MALFLGFNLIYILFLKIFSFEEGLKRFLLFYTPRLLMQCCEEVKHCGPVIVYI